MSEAELHFLRARLRGGITSKAKRGELASPLPVGLVYDEQGHVRLDPDAQVQQTLRLLFATFRRTGTARATVKYFRDQRLHFPRRLRSGPRKGDLVWGTLCHSRTLQVLHNPRYAGAFFFGRTRTRVGLEGKVLYQLKERAEWVALLPGAHPGYIAWEEFEDNQRRLLENAQAHGEERRKSPPGEGPALLQGLVLCGVCGRRMSVRYHEHRDRLDPDYTCQRTRIDYEKPPCQIIPGRTIDDAVGRLVLDTMTPLSVEVTLAVQNEILARQQEAERLRAQQVERAQYEADLARQRYMRCDPNNRLVATTLEAEWNTALRVLTQAQQEFEQQRQHDALQVTDEVRARVMALTADFPAVWKDTRTTDRDRKRMIRLLIEDVTLTKASQQIELQVRFRGGRAVPLTVPTPQPAWRSWQTPVEVIADVDQLLNDYTDRQVAEMLNAKGRRSGTGKPLTAPTVARIRKEYGLASRYDRLRARGLLTVDELATQLEVTGSTIKQWHRAGLLRGHLFTDKPEYLFELPVGEDRPSKQMGRKLSDRKLVSNHAPEVHPDA